MATSAAVRHSLWTYGRKQHWPQALSKATNSRRRRFPFLSISPNRMLALRLKASNKWIPKTKYASVFQYAALQRRSERLPLILLRTWLARQDTSSEPELHEALKSIKPAEWNDIMLSLASRGWTQAHFDHWLWILQGENGDVRVERLMADRQPKPVFLILLILRNDEVFRDPKSLLSLMDYITKVPIASGSSGQSAPLTDSDSTQIPMTGWLVSHFTILLRRLILHVQRLCPQALVAVARFAADYIRRASKRRYHQQCQVFNTALFLFKRPAFNRPMVNREYNWRAQRILLSMSDGLEKPLSINRASYRSITEVLLGLRKSNEEKTVAIRYAKTWPPYRQDFDGLDAKRTPEDDRSRSVRALMLMKEAGYEEDDYDRALAALGGSGAGAPTIQTRSLPPKQWEADKASLNFYSNWAMQIRATRNPQEAWSVFRDHMRKWDQAPNVQIYGEMFAKLHAEGIPPTSSALAGDLRENLPVHDANYTEYELARRTPPTISELYAQMLHEGIRPSGPCLHLLVKNSRSVEEALRYLEDSGFDDAVVKSLAMLKQPSHQVLHRIPLMTYNSYIQLLCRLQPNRRGGLGISSFELLPIRHAITLATTRLVAGTTAGVTFRPPWHSILRALSRPSIAVKDSSAAENDAEALSLFMVVFQRAEGLVGLDAFLFMYLCRAVQKTALSNLEARGMHADQTPLLEHGLHIMKTTFSKLSRPSSSNPAQLMAAGFGTVVGPPHLHAYMRALATMDDHEAMVGAMMWMLKHHKLIAKEAGRLGPRGPALVAKTFCAFHAFAGPLLLEEQEAALFSLMDDQADQGGTWRWPTNEEVDQYIRADLRGGSQVLHQRAVFRSMPDLAPEVDQEPDKQEMADQAVPGFE
ncbi:hypothetical protein F4780DRAFT_729531 [Xylariomycetidae sp. FL0641]|nr:hypothetical protein F4780DRAFT_729531 [Xylariomycetidae sp. FL0641]